MVSRIVSAVLSATLLCGLLTAAAGAAPLAGHPRVGHRLILAQKVVLGGQQARGDEMVRNTSGKPIDVTVSFVLATPCGQVVGDPVSKSVPPDGTESWPFVYQSSRDCIGIATMTETIQDTFGSAQDIATFRIIPPP